MLKASFPSNLNDLILTLLELGLEGDVFGSFDWETHGALVYELGYTHFLNAGSSLDRAETTFSLMRDLLRCTHESQMRTVALGVAYEATQEHSWEKVGDFTYQLLAKTHTLGTSVSDLTVLMKRFAGASSKSQLKAMYLSGLTQEQTEGYPWKTLGLLTTAWIERCPKALRAERFLTLRTLPRAQQEAIVKFALPLECKLAFDWAGQGMALNALLSWAATQERSFSVEALLEQACLLGHPYHAWAHLEFDITHDLGHLPWHQDGALILEYLRRADTVLVHEKIALLSEMDTDAFRRWAISFKSEMDPKEKLSFVCADFAQVQMFSEEPKEDPTKALAEKIAEAFIKILEEELPNSHEARQAFYEDIIEPEKLEGLFFEPVMQVSASQSLLSENARLFSAWALKCIAHVERSLQEERGSLLAKRDYEGALQYLLDKGHAHLLKVIESHFIDLRADFSTAMD